MASFYPILLNLSGKRCVVVGGGDVAERKIKSLVESDAAVTVITPRVSSTIRELAATGKIVLKEKNYQSSDLEDAFMVIGATDDPKINREVSRDAQTRRLLVNIVDAPELCNFIVPSVIKRGSLTVAIGTDGKSPALAKKLREDLETFIGPEYEVFTELLGELREKVKAKYQKEEERREAYQRIIQSEVLSLIKSGHLLKARERAYSCL